MNDPAQREYLTVPYSGWSAQTPYDLFAVLHQLMGHLGKRHDGDGQQLLARVWRVNSPLLKKIDALTPEWIPVNKPIRDFIAEMVPGMVLEVNESGRLVKKVVGHMNAESGTCGGCCSMRYETDVVVRYRMLDWEAE